jgi:putative endonuclease
MTRHNVAVGRAAEARAAEHYEAEGYTVVARNWRHGREGEIDLVLARRDVLVICEVKARGSDRFGTPAEAVDWRKQRRLRRLAVAFLAAHDVHPRTVRFDVACVRGPAVSVIEAAF